MDVNEKERYIVEQARIEVEHTRSWPTKIMAFYVAINFGLVGSLIALQKICSSFYLPIWLKVIITFLILLLAGWVVFLLAWNHKNYLTYRNLQVKFQEKNLKECTDYKLPAEWFERNEVCILTRLHGWGFYFYIVLMVTFLVVTGIWFMMFQI